MVESLNALLLAHERIGVDTNIVIYYIEENPLYLPVIEQIFDAIDEKRNIGITSYVTLLEVLVKPMQYNRLDLVELYKEILTSAFKMILLDENVAIKAAELRAKYKIRTPDSIQIAATIVANGSLFITNDTKLKRVTDIEVLVLKDIVEQIQ
ncbi:MAG: type II toxin-antitoxin system VapC family toxin [Methanosarcinales archaeon]